jgi:hypothetical protein
MIANHTAIDTYRVRHTVTISLLARILVAVEWHHRRLAEDGSAARWGYVGDLDNVNDKLREILAFIGEPKEPK